MDRFKVYAISYGGRCVPLHVVSSGKMSGRLEDKDGRTVYPYLAGLLTVCPHCTSRTSWARWRRFYNPHNLELEAQNEKDFGLPMQ